jgi:hypothetical protein
MNILSAILAPLAVTGTLPPVPGAINPEVTQANIQTTICVPGYSKTIRPPVRYTNALKRKQMAQYHVYLTTKEVEEDHLIPLSVGGHPSSPNNLWPEPWTGPWNARMKDQLEVKLHNMVCNGEVPLAVAQQAFATNWIQAYQKYVPMKAAGKRKRKKNYYRYF